MSDTLDGLDAFLSNDNNSNNEKKTTDTNASETKASNIEDEFSSLLSSFINQDDTPKEEASLSSLDSFVSNPQTSQPDANSIDSLLTTTVYKENIETTVNEEQSEKKLKTEEQDLARAISNFQDAIFTMADKKNFKVPETDYKEEMLFPNYKPSVGKKIANYMLACWDIVCRYDPENMKRLSKDANDEEYLTFAESLNDTDLQLAIISYVEILINVETCEFLYKQKHENMQKNRIKRELYEEYMELQERKALFIKKLKEKKFPIDVDKLINNYFRAAQNDATGAFEALTKNPAMFAPIDFDKIKPKFFGLIKVTPEDGIKANQKIGEYVKKLKV